MSYSLQPHGLQHARLPCPSLSPGVCSNSCPLSWWCHPTILSSVIPFSCLQSFPASGSFPMSQHFEPSGQCFGASASVLPVILWFLFFKIYKSEMHNILPYVSIYGSHLRIWLFNIFNILFCLINTLFSYLSPWEVLFVLGCYYFVWKFSEFSSVTQSCPSLCDPTDCSTSGFPVHHQLLEFTWVSDAIQPSYPFLSRLLLPSVFPSISIFPNESILHIRWPNYRSFSMSLPMNMQNWFPLGLTGWISL